MDRIASNYMEQFTDVCPTCSGEGSVAKTTHHSEQGTLSPSVRFGLRPKTDAEIEIDRIATHHSEVEGLVEEFRQKISHWVDGYYHDEADAEKLVYEYRTALTTHSAKEREAERSRIWSALCDLAESDERQFGAGELHTHLDDVHKIIRPQTDVIK